MPTIPGYETPPPQRPAELPEHRHTKDYKDALAETEPMQNLEALNTIHPFDVFAELPELIVQKYLATKPDVTRAKYAYAVEHNASEIELAPIRQRYEHEQAVNEKAMEMSLQLLGSMKRQVEAWEFEENEEGKAYLPSKIAGAAKHTVNTKEPRVAAQDYGNFDIQLFEIPEANLTNAEQQLAMEARLL